MKKITQLFVLVIFIITSHATYASPITLADYVLVQKSARKLFLLNNNMVIKSYDISLGRKPIGHKIKKGDRKTPEGLYTIDFRNRKSKYHLSLHITYPNEQDKARSKELNVNPGGSIYIHGLPNKKRNPSYLIGSDWTYGCIAVSNKQIRDIASYVPDGTPIHIKP
jgi:murein L,D-transpeptidase YafK